MITLSPYEEQQIEQNLPSQLAALKSKYPSAVYNAASAQHLPPLAPDIKPKLINIYYGEEDNDTYLPNISFKDGKLDFLYLIEECVDNPVIQVEADSNWIYIEVEQQILLDRLGDLELPKIDDITDEEFLAVTQKTQLLLEKLQGKLNSDLKV